MKKDMELLIIHEKYIPMIKYSYAEKYHNLLDTLRK